jgi:V/A-type H+-transporting ATPase subunit E
MRGRGRRISKARPWTRRSGAVGLGSAAPGRLGAHPLAAERNPELFAAIIKKETKNVLTGKFLEEALRAVLSGWKENGETDLTVLVPEKLLENLEKALHSQLASAVKGGAELRPGRHVDYGFKVSMKGGTAYYNFTEEGIAEILGEYLNPRIAEILKKSVAGEG